MVLEDTKNIRAAIILEVVGKPPEHLKTTLEDLIKQIDEHEGVKVVEKRIHEPVTIKERDDFFTTFADVELEVDHIEKLVGIMFKFMPANVEIIYPEVVALTNSSWTEFLSELTRRLHGYDEVARILTVEKDVLEKKLKSLLEGKRSEDIEDKENDKSEKEN
jgi:hypothetical protein